MTLFTLPSHLLPVLVIALMVMAAAVSDIFTYRISNRLNLTFALLFPVAALVVSMPFNVFIAHVSAGFSLLALGLLLFQLRAFGGGDAKLMATSALWLGWSAITPFLIWTALAGGVLGFVLLIIRRAKCPLDGAISHDVPYGVALAAGALAALPASDWW